MFVSLQRDEVLLIRGKGSTLAVCKVGQERKFYICAPEGEIVQFASPEDIIVASTPEVGPKANRALNCVLFLIREYESPLTVLPKGHTASKRVRVLVSVDECVRLSCTIEGGTHPAQNVLCCAPELDGMQITAVPDGITVESYPEHIALEKIQFL